MNSNKNMNYRTYMDTGGASLEGLSSISALSSTPFNDVRHGDYVLLVNFDFLVAVSLTISKALFGHTGLTELLMRILGVIGLIFSY